MRKKGYRVTAAALSAMMCLSLAACGSNGGTATTAAPTTKAAETTKAGGADTKAPETAAPEKQIEKPKKLKVMFDGTVVTTANGQAEFKAALEKELGIELEFIQPDHSAYYDNLAMTFAGGDIPDIVLLDSIRYLSYGVEGALWDMTEAWENSDLAKSGRIINQDVVDSMYINGKMYGMTDGRGNGCLTYVKKKWLDNVGLGVPTTYDEYLNMLKAFTEGDPDGNGVNGDTFAVTAAGILGVEAPYVNYLPEFYQDAYPNYYEKDGVWVDGFAEDAMVGALTRMQDAYSKGYMDKEIITNKTSDCRNKFYDDKCGVFTYWAGTWAYNLKSNLEAKELDGELVMLPPIKELGNYLERQTGGWCITTACENPEGAFKYFLEPMLDGGAVQSLWTYGVKGVHWDDKAETVTYGDKSATWEEGQFHMLPNLEKPTTLYTKNHIDPMLALAKFVDEDPGMVSVTDVARTSQENFNEWAKQAPRVPSYDEVYNEYVADINDMRKVLVTEVVTAGRDAKEAIEDYKAKTASMTEEILASLNSK